MTLTHRNATLDDVEDIVAIYNQTIPSRMVTADLEPVTVKQKMGWFLDHSPSYRPIWVFEEDGKICAWVSFQAFHERAAYDKTAELSIYIHEDYRGKKNGHADHGNSVGCLRRVGHHQSGLPHLRPQCTKHRADEKNLASNNGDIYRE